MVTILSLITLPDKTFARDGKIISGNCYIVVITSPPKILFIGDSSKWFEAVTFTPTQKDCAFKMTLVASNLNVRFESYTVDNSGNFNCQVTASLVVCDALSTESANFDFEIAGVSEGGSDINVEINDTINLSFPVSVYTKVDSMFMPVINY